jgi:hypothetical protein
MAIKIESVFGDDLGPVTCLNLKSNLHRKRQRPHHAPINAIKQGENAVDLAHREYSQLFNTSLSSNKDK